MIARNYQRRTALTILELLVSVSILALLAALLLPAAAGNTEQYGPKPSAMKTIVCCGPTFSM
jgi:Tfp pilus assembly protein FimT